jgi:hypothetical protein
MTKKTISFIGLFFIIYTFPGCSRRENIDTQNNNRISEASQSIEIKIEESIAIETTETNIFSISDFFFYEIMDGLKDFTWEKGNIGVEKIFGMADEINVLTFEPFWFQGGTVIEIHEYIYEDFIHLYYVFEYSDYVTENNRKMYSGFRIVNRLDRLKTINIGDTSEILLSTFSDRCFSWESNDFEFISFHIGHCEVLFRVYNGIIDRIIVNFLLV